jgi:EAL domain-containing protein (putative c-di-GMP-specific phosphodiesterase class I)
LSNTQRNAALRPAAEASVETAEMLGAQLLSLLPALRLYSVALFDANGDLQWLSEGALGSDEHRAVEAAIVTLTSVTTRAHLQASLADNRAAVFLAVRTPAATLAGLVMVLTDAKSLSSGNPAARILTTNMRSVLHRIAVLLAPPALAAPGSSPETRPPPSGTLPLTDTPDEAQKALELLEPGAARALALDNADAALPATELEPLLLRELIPLRAGGRTRRFQIVPAAEPQRGDALTTLKQLLAWLRHNPMVLERDPVSFTIGVSAQALADADLPAALGRALAPVGLEPWTIGFELREAACVSQFALAERFIAQCEQMRCFTVIDDFTFNTGALDLLRSSAVRMLKLETRLGATALRDRLAQARVVAIAQAAKVLGIHCAAKYVESQSGRRWLAAVGFDFTQSTKVEPMQRLTEIASA